MTVVATRASWDPLAGMRRLLPGAGLAVAALAGAVAVISPSLAVGLAAVAVLGAAVFAHPPLAAYAYLALAPLVAGIDRGALLPLLRPNEALLLLLATAVGARLALAWSSGDDVRPRLDAVDGALVLMAFASSVLPLLSLVARGEPVTLDDLLFAATLWKFLLLFWLVRATVATPRQVAACLWVTFGALLVVAAVAVLQSLQLLGVPELLATAYAPFDDPGALDIGRGTSTLASAHAVGDVMVFGLALALAWLLRGHAGTPWWRLGAVAVVCTLGALASGQFSAALGLVVAVTAIGWVTGRLRRLLTYAVPAGGAAVLALWPVVARRLAGFTTAEGIPQSWIGRWENLQEHVWPELFADWRHLAVGVRPEARVAAPEWWRDWIWIESGHTWLLWNGGIPLLLAFLAFLWVTIRATARVARARDDTVGVAAAGTFAALWVVALLSTLDPHLTLRGTADLLFPLLALALPRSASPAAPAAPGVAAAGTTRRRERTTT